MVTVTIHYKYEKGDCTHMRGHMSQHMHMFTKNRIMLHIETHTQTLNQPSVMRVLL